MSRLRLRMAAMAYERFAPLRDGEVGVEGADLDCVTIPNAGETFRRMVVDREFDVAELGLTYLVRLRAAGDDGLVALPVLPARVFRHSAVFVRTGSGIETPADLDGRRIGEFLLYGHDAGVWAKGVLADDFGARLDGASWLIGGLDRPIAPIDFVPRPVPDGVDVEYAPAGTDLGALLVSGGIDALISGNVPRAVREGSPAVRRLFPDFGRVEREWFSRTHVFPPAHVLVARRDVLEAHPGLARRLMDAFGEALEVALRRRDLAEATGFATDLEPWRDELLERNRALGGAAWWEDGVRANRPALERFLRYHAEQGLSERAVTVDELIAPDVLDT